MVFVGFREKAAAVDMADQCKGELGSCKAMRP